MYANKDVISEDPRRRRKETSGPGAGDHRWCSTRGCLECIKIGNHERETESESGRKKRRREKNEDVEV